VAHCEYACCGRWFSRVSGQGAWGAGCWQSASQASIVPCSQEAGRDPLRPTLHGHGAAAPTCPCTTLCACAVSTATLQLCSTMCMRHAYSEHKAALAAPLRLDAAVHEATLGPTAPAAQGAACKLKGVAGPQHEGHASKTKTTPAARRAAP